VTAGTWLQQDLWTWGPGSQRQGLAVGCVVPTGFEAYARVLHPAWRETERGLEPVRWSEIASWTGSTVHPMMQFHRIAKLPAHPGQRAQNGEGFRPKARFLPPRASASLRSSELSRPPPIAATSASGKALACRS